MKRFYYLTSLFLAFVLSTSTLLHPLAIYAESISNSYDQTDETQRGSDASDTASDSAKANKNVEDFSALGLDQSSSTNQEKGSAQTPASSVSVADESDGSFIEDSWRYDNGTLRSDLSDDLSAYADFFGRSMHRLPQGATAQGVDVSEHNGSIDWQAVKNAGIDYAILRVGFAGDTTGGRLDYYFQRNVSECERLGIPYGVYLYSYARNENEAAAEARLVISALKGHKVSLPVYYDLEESKTNSDGSPKWTPFNNPSLLAGIAKTFCNQISAAGYAPGIYANVNWFTNYLIDPCFSNSGWSIWTAQYWYGSRYDESINLKPKAPAKFDSWQYSCRGSVPGISGDVDTNYWYGSSLAVKKDENSTLNEYEAIFDADYYFEKYPEIKARCNGDKLAALDYFLNTGLYEGQRGNASFDVQSYFNEYPDLRAAYKTDIWSYYKHYMKWGLKEGRHGTGCNSPRYLETKYSDVEYSAVYDPIYYLGNNADLKSVFTKSYGSVVLTDYGGLLAHFVRYGMSEGRASKSSFDLASYYNANEDLRAAYGLDLKKFYLHYIRYGKREGRVCKGVSDLTSFRCVQGGIDYSPVYDGAYYRSNNADLRTHYMKNVGAVTLFDDGGLLAHFVRYGANELRRGNTSFDVKSYYNEYSDLRKVYRKNWIYYYQHYCRYGKREGRHPSGCNVIKGYNGFQNPVGFYYVDSASVRIPHQGQGIFGYATPSRISNNATKNDCINAMITRAYDYVGTTRYIWDYSCAPGVGVDCAGLVMQSLYATGMDLGRYNPWDHFHTPGHDHYANDMWNDPKFKHLPFSSRQRGDLVCYKGHIAIYIGNNKIIEAASPRVGVRVHSVYVGYSIKGVLRPFI